MQITVYPVPGRLILQPEHNFRPVPPEGVTVSGYDPFYYSALRVGDLTKTPPESTPAPVVPPVDDGPDGPLSGLVDTPDDESL
ncbi:hypothetical protein [Methylocystis hirsuta]|uniref:DUF2635 domain-containing protein n=1 Tax=Methylocystis hirsuta TaxID=369798 RepID=A0A3M9XM69_9HYPH|nr:hypothetical protein [Methylocystis hirsuta]RNJ49363.1 hypothetical protein D1O30_06885 [Methylocystis hirsuta]